MSSSECDFTDGSPVQAVTAGTLEMEIGQEDGGYVAYHLYENFTTAAEVHTVELTTTSFYGCQDTRNPGYYG